MKQLTFIVQIETAGKWKAVYRGVDPNMAVESHRAALSEVGADKVRCLKSDGVKEDGTPKWVLVKVPVASPEASDNEDDFNILRDWFGTPLKAAGTIIFFAFCLYVVVGLFSSDDPKLDRPDPQTATTATPKAPTKPKAPPKPRIPALEKQLEGYLRAGGPTDLNSVEGMRQVSAYMNIVASQFDGGIFGSVGAEVESIKTTTVEKGAIQFNGRSLPAGLVQATAKVVNRSAGKRFSVCVRMGGAVDESFQVIRSIAFFSCQGNDVALSEWTAKKQYQKQ